LHANLAVFPCNWRAPSSTTWSLSDLILEQLTMVCATEKAIQIAKTSQQKANNIISRSYNSKLVQVFEAVLELFQIIRRQHGILKKFCWDGISRLQWND
jgi:hypothetical protein